MTTVEFLLSVSSIALIMAVILLGRVIYQARRRSALRRKALLQQAEAIYWLTPPKLNGDNESPKKPVPPARHEVGTVDVGSFPEAWMRLCGKHLIIPCQPGLRVYSTYWLSKSERNYLTYMGFRECTIANRGA